MDETGRESAIIDVSGMTLLELLTSREPAIVEAIRHLLSERREPRNVLLGWQSANVHPPADGDATEHDSDLAP